MSDDPQSSNPHNNPTHPSGADQATAWTTLAHLLRPQGRKGEVLAELSTDFPERFATHPAVFLAPAGFAGTVESARAIDVLNHWLPVGRNHGRIVLAFKGIDSIEQAQTLAGLDVMIPEESRLPLEDDAEYISDLVGCTVFDHSVTPPAAVGVVTGVEFALTPDGGRRLPDAAPLLSVQTDAGEEILVPYVQAFLLALAVDRQRIEMRLPAGLLELNRRNASAIAEDEPERP